MGKINIIVHDNGRIELPELSRKKLALKAGDELTLYIQDGEIRLTPKRRGAAMVQRSIVKYADADDDSTAIHRLVAQHA